MNLRAPLYYRCVLLVLLLGAQWCASSLAIDRDAVFQRLAQDESASEVTQHPIAAQLVRGNDFYPLAALLRFSDRTLAGSEDFLDLFFEVDSRADSLVQLPCEAGSDCREVEFTGSSASLGQTLLLQHTRLQI
jgi:hypothetical protein